MASADELRRRREDESAFAFLYDMARERDAQLAAEGRRPFLGGLLSVGNFGAGADKMDVLRDIDFEGVGSGLLGLLSPVARAIDAPISAYRGTIPQEDMLNEAMNVTGMAMAGGGAIASPQGALASNALRMARRGAAAKASKGELDPIGYQKPKMRGYLSDTDVQTSDLGENLSRQPMSWEDMEGKVVLPFYGDRTSRGLLVEGVNDLKFDQPVYTEGGVDFMRGPAAQQDRSIWASNQNIIKRIGKEADAAARDFGGADIFGVTGSMSPDANDFATFTGAAMAELVKGAKITKKSAKEFDKVMRAIDPDFVGVLSPNLRDWAVSTSSPKRKSFIRLMESAPMQEKNFPSPAEARYSVTDPSQRDMPAGMFGLGAARIDREMPLLYNEPKGNHYRANVPHSTYNTQIAGEYAGSLPPVPQGLLFRDVYDAMEGKTTKSGHQLNQAHKTQAIKLKMPAQQITPEVLEGILDYLSRMEK
jgi:hypothetical protein